MFDDLFFDTHDKLDREKYAKNITNYLQESNIRVICVNSIWGSGKTWFAHMWMNMLRSDEYKNIAPVYYNAWENDDCQDALIPLLSEINDQLWEGHDNTPEKIKSAAGAILKSGFYHAVNTATMGLIDLEKGEEELNKETFYNTAISAHKELKTARKQFCSELETYLVSSNKKAFIFVDELDRCRPTFAIETLERIKHLFNVKNIYFILFLDKVQLSESVKVLYGNNTDTAGYLMRFIDVEYNLPISLDKYVRFKINTWYSEESKYYEILTKVIPLFSLSLRDINKLEIWSKVLIANKYPANYRREFHVVIVYFMMLKLRHMELYNKILVDKDYEIIKSPESILAVKDVDNLISDYTFTKNPIAVFINALKNYYYNNESIVLENNEFYSILIKMKRMDEFVLRNLAFCDNYNERDYPLK